MTTIAFGLLMMLAAVLVSGPAEASTPVTACGTVINVPGDYHLTGDLGPCTGDGVVIDAADVTFTLAGHTISGVSSPGSCDTVTPQIGVRVTGPLPAVHITGGTVAGFVDGIVVGANSA